MKQSVWKSNKFVLFALLATAPMGLKASVTAELTTADLTPQAVQAAFDDVARQNLTPKERAELEKMRKEGVRSISAKATGDPKWAASAYPGNNQLFLGNSEGGKDAFAVSVATLDGDKLSINGIALDEVKVNAQDDDADKSPVFGNKIRKIVAGPNGSVVVALDGSAGRANAGTAPWDAHPWDNSPASAAKTANALVCLVEPATNNVLVNGSDSDPIPNTELYPLHTSDDGRATAAIHALAATKKEVTYNVGGDKAALIFAATSKDGTDFRQSNVNDNENAIVPIIIDDTTPRLIAASSDNFTDIDDDNKGKAVSMTIAAALTSATNPSSLENGAAIDMWWDDHLQRLFVGLSELKSGGTNGDLVSGLIVGKIDASGNGVLVLEPAVDFAATDLFDKADQDDAAKYVFGGLRDTSNSIVKLFKVRTMHTSTGKDYVITVGGVTNGGAAGVVSPNTWVNAHPVVPAADPAAGKIAEFAGTATDPYVALTDNANLAVVKRDSLVNSSLKAVVGADPRLISTDTSQAISDIQILGDTVYVSVNADQAANHNTQGGIFSSKALFDANGNIRAWTPWENIGGKREVVFGFGFDPASQNMMYLTTDDGTAGADLDTVKATLWNAGDAAAGGVHDGEPLSSVIDTEFTANGGAVYGLFEFDAGTPGFKPQKVADGTPANRHQQLTMMVATGNKEVALIQGGKFDTNFFKQTVKFDATTAGAAKNVFIYKNTGAGSAGEALDSLGRITASELSRNATGAATKGWLFVGGDNGVCVLRNDNGGDAGKGFTTGLNELKYGMNAGDYPGGVNFKWALLKDGANSAFSNVRKLVSDGTYLYIVSKDKIQRITLDIEGFKTGVLHANNNLQTIAQAGTEFKADGGAEILSTTDEFVDLIVQDNTNNVRKFAVGTTKGIYQNDVGLANNAGNINGLKWSNKIDSTGAIAFPLGQVSRFDFESQTTGLQFVADKAVGNLYAVAMDDTNQNLNVYRFDVQGGVLKAITEPYKKGTTVTPYFYRIGSVVDNATVGSLDERTDVPTEFNISAIPVTPNPRLFEKDFSSNDTTIDLGLTIPAGVTITPFVRDTASGAVYIPGGFGVRVNE